LPVWSKTPAEAGYIEKVVNVYTRNKTSSWMDFGKLYEKRLYYYRVYCEWNISKIPDDAVFHSPLKLLYAGEYETLPMTDLRHIHELNLVQPTVADSWEIFEYAKLGTAYIKDSDTFPEVGNDKEIDLGADALAEFESAITSRSWFAITIVTDEQTINDIAYLRRGEGFSPLNPMLHIEYWSPTESSISFPTGLKSNHATNVTESNHAKNVAESNHAKYESKAYASIAA